MIEYYVKTKNFKAALELLYKMTERKMQINPFLDQEIIALIYNSNGLEYKKAEQTKTADEIGEDINEEPVQE